MFLLPGSLLLWAGIMAGIAEIIVITIQSLPSLALNGVHGTEVTRDTHMDLRNDVRICLACLGRASGYTLEPSKTTFAQTKTLKGVEGLSQGFMACYRGRANPVEKTQGAGSRRGCEVLTSVRGALSFGSR